MQFPVPQFTDVEDKIIGPLTIKQFGIIFGVGIIIFLGYSATKSILVLVFLFVLFGVPGLGLAFANINGRPLYSTMGYFFKFLSQPKVLIFHKEAGTISSDKKLKDVQLSQPAEPDKGPVKSPQENLKQVQELLSKTAAQENEVVGKIR